MSPSLLTPLVDARDPAVFGGKSAQLAAALLGGLPVPGGYSVAWDRVDAVVAARLTVFNDEPGPWAVRSSAIGEDSAAASFAGAHLSVLGVVGADAVAEAIRQVQASALDPSALTYREQHGLEDTPRMGVVIQRMVGAEVAGVLFTRNPVTGESERVIEASWGLGETVVAGLVTPDQYRLGADGRVLQRSSGEKDVALVLGADGRTREEPVFGDRVEALCLDDANLRALHELALACDRVFGAPDHDIEFAFVGGMVHLLQRRPITHG